MSLQLPRLLYISDVPVESTYHGSVLLYRLLEDYPEYLSIIELGNRSNEGKRLIDADYFGFNYPLDFLKHTRFSPLAADIQYLSLGVFSAYAIKHAAGRRVDAILTVGHGMGWMIAKKTAERLGIPLHMIVHDDIGQTNNCHKPLSRRIVRKFADAYRKSASRLCVSPYMEQEYLDKFGASGEVLLPSRSKNSSVIPYEPPIESSRPLTLGVAGTLNSKGFVNAIQDAADAIGTINGNIVLYGPFREADVRRSGLVGENIIFRGLIPSESIIQTMKSELDIVLLPLSFLEVDRPNMQIHFPSKLTDYTATSLPVLVYGPDYSSAVRWSSSKPGFAAVATNKSELHLQLRELRSHAYRVMLGKTAFDVGKANFDHEHARNRFYSAVLKS